MEWSQFRRKQQNAWSSWPERPERGVAPADCWNWGERGLKKYKRKGLSLVGSLGSPCRYKRPGSSVSPVQIIYFLTVHYFNLCVPIAQQYGHAVVQGRLSLNVCPVLYSLFFCKNESYFKCKNSFRFLHLHLHLHFFIGLRVSLYLFESY